jgi:hypothetical protein
LLRENEFNAPYAGPAAGLNCTAKCLKKRHDLLDAGMLPRK